MEGFVIAVRSSCYTVNVVIVEFIGHFSIGYHKGKLWRVL